MTAREISQLAFICWFFLLGRGSNEAQAASSAGESERPKVAVVPLRGDSPLPPPIRAELQRRVEASLAGDELSWTKVRPQDSCNGADCWRALSDRYQATHVLEVTVEHRDPDYLITVALRDGTTGSDVAALNDRCDLCGYEELADAVADEVANARRRLLATAVPAPVMVVRSDPPGATVTLDGAPLGKTPLEVPVEPGTHRVRIERPGFRGLVRNLALVDGMREEISAELVPVGPLENPRRGRVYTALGATALGLGIGSLGGGIAMLALHEQPIRSDCDGSNQDAEGRCRYLYDTRAGGIGLTVAGVALTTTAIALLTLGAKRKRARALRAWLRPEGVAVSGRF